MKYRPEIGLLILALSFFSCAATTGHSAENLRTSFAHPPDSARPWVYWTWIDGNINKEGITADLEAMQRVGIGGAIILDVSQSTPAGPVGFFGARWQTLFKHAVTEAKRLGLEINMNDGAGYYGSGGSWVPHDKAMQTVVQSETHITGGMKWSGTLARPNENEEYRDIAVLAIRETVKSNYQIPDFIMKALQWKSWIAYTGILSEPSEVHIPTSDTIPLNHVVDLTGCMVADGSLTWDAPVGEWTIIRFGHAWNGHVIGPSRPGDGGPETDKLDKSATALHFNAFVKRLNDLIGPEAKNTLVATHIDSWEGGGQNWTAAMREEFTKRRGYDPVGYLPILTGRVLSDLQVTERFLYDLRKTVSELMIENYTAEFQRLAHGAGLRNTFESYTTIGNDLDNAQFVDEPMAEFWTPNGQGADFYPTVKSMSSAAHLNGRMVVGAESFTSGSREKFLWHPAMIKSIGDDAFCGGINRFVFHRYAAQPFSPGVKPGMQMGPWGLHYERTNTWWEFSGPWHEYLTRCQYMLRQGKFVADVLKLEPEEPLHRFQAITLTGYDYDACGADTFLHGAVSDHQLFFPSGAHYRLIILPHTTAMTVGLLTHIRDLVRQGAAILGEPPQKTPGLTNYPESDVALKKLTDEIWVPNQSRTDHSLGLGRVFRGITPEQALAALKVSPDFTNNAGLKYIHRTTGDVELYFLSHAGSDAITANCRFRVTGKQPEWWNPRTGTITPLQTYSSSDREGTTVSLPFEANGSGFIVFQNAGAPAQQLTSVTWNGVDVVENGNYLPLQPGTKPVFNLITGDLLERGSYVFHAADGTARQTTVSTLPEPVNVAGPWVIRFPANSGAPSEIEIPTLISWSHHSVDGVKYFSGTATYFKTLTITSLAPAQRLFLDLGKVQIMAKVRLNGKALGILWKPPYRLEITDAVKAGGNALEIEVVNLWVNRLIGDEQLPEDSDRNANGTLKKWPQWLLDEKPSPSGRFTFSSWRLWKKEDPLQESGLIGPVTLRYTQRMEEEKTP
ncbi:MAG TPA: glycosyl hydrolase [Lacunisphaera sp.]|jgi:hypothetical protein